MEQVYILLFIAVFGSGEINSHSSVYATMEACEYNHAVITGQMPAVYVETVVISQRSTQTQQTLPAMI